MSFTILHLAAFQERSSQQQEPGPVSSYLLAMCLFSFGKDNVTISFSRQIRVKLD